MDSTRTLLFGGMLPNFLDHCWGKLLFFGKFLHCERSSMKRIEQINNIPCRIVPSGQQKDVPRLVIHCMAHAIFLVYIHVSAKRSIIPVYVYFLLKQVLCHPSLPPPWTSLKWPSTTLVLLSQLLNVPLLPYYHPGSVILTYSLPWLCEPGQLPPWFSVTLAMYCPCPLSPWHFLVLTLTLAICSPGSC